MKKEIKKQERKHEKEWRQKHTKRERTKKAVNNKKSNNEGKVERVGVTNGRLEGMQEGNKRVSVERQVGRSNVQEEK